MYHEGEKVKVCSHKDLLLVIYIEVWTREYLWEWDLTFIKNITQLTAYYGNNNWFYLVRNCSL